MIDFLPMHGTTVERNKALNVEADHVTNLWFAQEAPSTARMGMAEIKQEPCGQCCSCHMCINLLDVMMLCFEVLFDAQEG